MFASEDIKENSTSEKNSTSSFVQKKCQPLKIFHPTPIIKWLLPDFLVCYLH